jgi:hypothetical protein
MRLSTDSAAPFLSHTLGNAQEPSYSHKIGNNRTAQIRHLCDKITVLSCHRYLILSSVAKRKSC